MSKLLRTTDRLLIGLSIFGDLLESVSEALPSKKKFWHSAYSMLPEDYKKDSYYSTVSRMLSDNYIKKIITNDGVKLQITGKGKNRLVRNFPMIMFQNNRWDRKWRTLSFDISEKSRQKRDGLRRKLKELGFGMLQESIWITPNPIEEDMADFLKNNDLEEETCLFVSEKLITSNLSNLVEKVWKISDVNDMYRRAFEIGDKDLYFGALKSDPFLPKEMLPKLWWANKAKNLFSTLQKM